MKLLTELIKRLKDKDHPGPETFAQLFHEHAERLKRHTLTAEEIGAKAPALLGKIHAAIRAMDQAWLHEDLEAFDEAIRTIESLYQRTLREVKA